MEALEDRWLPSTLTVASVADNGPGTLRADIAAAQSGDTIVFAPNLNGQTITLTSGQLDINKNLTIQGPGAGQLTVSGGNTSRVFLVGGTNATLSGLTISQGNATLGPLTGEGGGILDLSSTHGTLTISDCVLSDNRATYGGGIANVQGASVTIVNSTLSGNSAANGAYGQGGGVYSVGGTVAIENSNLSDNFAEHAGGGIWTGNTTMTVNGCTLSGNTEAYTNGHLGDDIYSNGSSTLTISDSVFGFISGNRPAIYGPWINGGGNTFE